MPTAPGSPRSGRRTSTAAAAARCGRSRPRPPSSWCWTTRIVVTGASQHRQVAVELERGDLLAVLDPPLALVSQEEVEHALTERLGDEFGLLHDRDRLGEARRQGLDAQRTALAVGQRPDVVLGAVGQVEALVDAPEPRGEDERVGEVRVAGAVEGAVLDP